MEPSCLDFHVLYCQNTGSLVSRHFPFLNVYVCYSRLLHWYMQGMSGFYYAALFFNNSGTELHNLTNFTATVQAFCNLTNTTVRITVLCSMQQLFYSLFSLLQDLTTLQRVDIVFDCAGNKL